MVLQSIICQIKARQKLNLLVLNSNGYKDLLIRHFQKFYTWPRKQVTLVYQLAQLFLVEVLFQMLDT